MTYHHNTRILCDTCNTASTHHTVTAAFDAIDQHILDTGHQVSYYRMPDGWLLFGGITC